ncbi:hypothetical protein H9P43_002620 [Blastocladiella emersonii ATCC 22665]|nr:hypothetical protein H9P43_002620 [Blastocladiella emersonii ATCC 22665]
MELHALPYTVLEQIVALAARPCSRIPAASRELSTAALDRSATRIAWARRAAANIAGSEPWFTPPQGTDAALQSTLVSYLEFLSDPRHTSDGPLCDPFHGDVLDQLVRDACAAQKSGPLLELLVYFMHTRNTDRFAALLGRVFAKWPDALREWTCFVGSFLYFIRPRPRKRLRPQ